MKKDFLRGSACFRWPALLIFKTLVAASTFLFPAVRGRAATLTWTGAVNGNWSEPGNWDAARAPQNGDLLSFYDNTPHDIMVNDLTNLSCALAFDDADGDYSLSGNAVYVSSFEAAPGTPGYTGYDRTVTINCALLFPNGGTIDGGAVAGPVLGGENKEYLYLNGGLDVYGGTLSIHAEGNSGFSGHIYIAGALSGAGDVKAHVDEIDGSTKGSIEFDSASNGTFSGTLWLSTDGDSTIDFNQSPGVTVAGLVGVHNGAAVNLNVEQTDQSGTTLEIASGGQLSLTGGNATFFRIIMENGSTDSQSSLLNTGTHLLGLNSGIVVGCDNDTHAPIIQGRLNLNGFETIDVDGTAAIGLNLPANIEGNGFKKVGTSTLVLQGTNTFTGTAEVDEGTLDVRNSNALGAINANTLLNGGLLTLRDSISGITLTAGTQDPSGDSSDLPGAGLLAISSTPVVWSGPMVLNTNLDVFGDDVTFSGTISGDGGLGFFNLGTAQITGNSANTFDGELLVRCPLLELNKPNGFAVNGPIFVGGGSGSVYELRWLQPYQENEANLTVYANGLANLNNNDEALFNLTLAGGEVETGSGVLHCRDVQTTAATATAVINGNIAMAFSAPTGSFDVSDGSADPDLLVNAIVSGTFNALEKTGTGTMALVGANTYLARTVVEQGTLDVDNVSALGNVANLCDISDGATVQLNSGGTIGNDIEMLGAGVGGTNGAIATPSTIACNLAGSITLDGPATVSVASTASLSISGVIGGGGSLTKIGPGSLTLSGGSPNTFSGDVTNESGLLYLSKSGATPIAVPGNLTLGPAPDNAAASAILLSPNSIGGSTVTVNANAGLNLNGRSQTLSQLNLNDGGSVQTGSGILNLTSGATVSVGSLNKGVRGGSRSSASIQGNIGLTPNGASVNFDVSPYTSLFFHDSAAELEVPATISVNGTENPNLADAGITKNGNGRMRLSGTNTFLGGTIVNSGRLQVDGSLSLGGAVQVNAGGILKGAGSIGRLVMFGNSATVAPGDNPGILTCSAMDSIGSGFSGIMNVELNGTTPGSQYDQLNSAGVVNLSGISLTGSLGYTPATNDQFMIINNGSRFPVSGTFNSLPEGGAVAIGGHIFRITYHGGDGNDVVLSDLGAVTIPELSIEPAGTNLVTLLWPTNALAFRLQSNTNLDNLDPTNWSTVSPTPVVIGANNVVTNAVNAAQKFYRLINP